MPARRRFRRRGQRRSQHRHECRSPGAARRDARDDQGRRGRTRARRLPGQDHRARARAEGRCASAEPQPDPRAACGYRHKARARNLRRRRQMQSRRQRRRARRDGAVLSAQPRHPRCGSAPHARRRFLARAGRGDCRPGVARAFAAPPRAAARKVGGLGMAASPLRIENGLARGFDPRIVRREFPIFTTHPGLVFLDSGASAQKPRAVIDGIADFYRTDYANVHRGVYSLSARATDRFEEAREKARAFLNAADEGEIVFLRGATEAINLVAQSWGPASLKAGDEIVISDVENHSNIVPWQMLCERIGTRLIVAPTDPTGEFDLAAFEALLNARTRLVAVAHAKGARGLIDGCQALPRMPVDVQALGCDFYVFSGHKAYGPTGTGVLYGRYDALQSMPPWQTGGGMITSVEYAKTEFQD